MLLRSQLPRTCYLLFLRTTTPHTHVSMCKYMDIRVADLTEESIPRYGIVDRGMYRRTRVSRYAHDDRTIPPLGDMRSGHPSNRLTAYSPHTCFSDAWTVTFYIRNRPVRVGSTGYTIQEIETKRVASLKGYRWPRRFRSPLCFLIIDANPIDRPIACNQIRQRLHYRCYARESLQSRTYLVVRIRPIETPEI